MKKMTALQQEAISIIQAMPEAELIDFMPALRERRAKIESEEERKKRELFKELDELFAKEPPLTEEQRKEGQKRAEHLRKCFEEFDKATGGYNPWSSEEEMIEELARDRRERMAQ